MTDALWTDDYNAVWERYVSKEINCDQFLVEMKRLGFAPDEAHDHLAIADEDREARTLDNGQFGVGA